MASKAEEAPSRGTYCEIHHRLSRSRQMRSGSTRTSNRIELQVDLNYEVAAPGADFVFNVHAARTPSQSLSGERLVLSPAVESQTHTDPATGNRYLRGAAPPRPRGPPLPGGAQLEQ